MDKFHVGKVTLEERIVDLIKRWATAYPQELAALDRMMKELRDKRKAGLRRPKKGKHGAHIAEIPQTLNIMLQHEIDQHWLIDYKVRNLVFAHFQVGMMERAGYEYQKR